jgi:hypothetical protein
MRRLVALALTLSVLAACGGDEESSTTTTRAETTTTAAAGPSQPLTGQPGEPANRPALIVKLDNAPKARPQAGLASADVVIEEAVEGGVTRLFTIFHSQVPAQLGPVRSARSTDIALAAQLGRPLFAYSGANSIFLRQVREAPLQDVGIERVTGAYRREKGRPAPYNLFTTGEALFAAAESGAAAPPPLFQYGPSAGEGKPTEGIHIEFRGRVVTEVDWRWDAAKTAWVRTQNGTAHVDADGAQVGTPNVVIQVVPYTDTGIRDQSGEPVPEAGLFGEGRALVLRDGKAYEGRWSRPEGEATTRYTSTDGSPLNLTPGTTWLELAREDANGVVRVL